MSRTQPIVFEWKALDVLGKDGEVVQTWAMVPVPRYQNVARRQFGDGGEHIMEESAERSRASHSQYFAALHDLFQSIPENISARWPTETHFRRWLLIETGWFEEKEFDLMSEKHARALGNYIRIEDEYARIAIRGTKVIIRRAKSQSLKAMGAADFKQSKKDVLDLAEQMVGVPRGAAIKNAGHAA